METITVRIPPKNNFYTMFAEGIVVDKYKQGDVTFLSFDSSKVLILYYHYPKHRRIYLCLPKEKSNDSKLDYRELPGLNKNVAVLYQLSGRSFDRFKRAMSYLVKKSTGNIFNLPSIFFFQVAYLSDFKKNMNYNLDLLLSRYKTIGGANE